MATNKHTGTAIPQVARIDTTKGHTGADLPAAAPELWGGNTPAEAVPMAKMVAVDGETELNTEDLTEELEGTQPNASNVNRDAVEGGDDDDDGSASSSDEPEAEQDYSKVPEPTEEQVKAVYDEGDADAVKALADGYGYKASTKQEAAENVARARLLEQYPYENLWVLSGLDAPEGGAQYETNHLISTILNK